MHIPFCCLAFASVVCLTVHSVVVPFAQAGLCCIHCPPGVTAEVETYSFNNVIVYRAETIGATINLLRFYLVWRCYRGIFVETASGLHFAVADDAPLRRRWPKPPLCLVQAGVVCIARFCSKSENYPNEWH